MTPAAPLPDFAAEARGLSDDLIALRRDLHRNPEIGNDLPATQARVLAALDGLPLEITTGRSLTSITAVLRGARPGPTVLLRGDMDALPVAEETGLDFASTNGAMHACGHDLHTAGLVGAARLLCAHQDELAGSVIFMFQPGEEGPGGAGPMIDEGVLDAAGTLTNEVARSVGRDEEEREKLLNAMLPPMLVGGFTSVSAGSVAIASVLVSFL